MNNIGTTLGSMRCMRKIVVFTACFYNIDKHITPSQTTKESKS